MQNKSKGRPDGLPLILNSYFLLITSYLRLRLSVAHAVRRYRVCAATGGARRYTREQ